jgi:hypothetical protein
VGSVPSPCARERLTDHLIVWRKHSQPVRQRKAAWRGKHPFQDCDRPPHNFFASQLGPEDFLGSVCPFVSLTSVSDRQHYCLRQDVSGLPSRIPVALERRLDPVVGSGVLEQGCSLRRGPRAFSFWGRREQQ